MTVIITVNKTGEYIAKRLTEQINADIIKINIRDVNRFTLMEEVVRKFQDIIFITDINKIFNLIAPFIDKADFQNTGVVCCDEGLQCAITVMPGKLGSADNLTSKAARILGTNTSVLNYRRKLKEIKDFSFECFAEKNRCVIKNPDVLAYFNDGVRNGSKILLVSDFRIQGILPQNIILFDPDDRAYKRAKLCVIITNEPYKLELEDDLEYTGMKILYLNPRNLNIGIHFKKGIGFDEINDTLNDFLEQYGYVRESIKCISSIDIKSNDGVLNKLAQSLDAEYKTFGTDELLNINSEYNDIFTINELVGATSICERCAVLSVDNGALAVDKTEYRGISFAVSEEIFYLNF